MATLQDILGGLPPGLLTPEQEAMAERRARNAGLMNLGFALLQSSQGQRGQPKPSLGQIIGQAGPVGAQAYQQSFDQTLKGLLLQQQMADAQKKRQQEQQQQQAIETYISSLPPEQQAQFRAFPQQASEAMFREPKVAPGVIGEYQAAVRDGLISPETSLAQYVEMKKPPAPTATAIAGDRVSEFEKVAQREQAQNFSEIQKAGVQAGRAIRDVEKLGTILDRVPTGSVAALKQIAGNFGIKTEGLDDIQAAQALINKLVPQQRPPGSGPMSDADLELFKQSLPRIINQPGGNKQIIDTLRAINQYVIQESKIASDVLNKRISPEEGYAQIQSLQNPLESISTQQQSVIGTDLQEAARRELERRRKAR